MGGGGEEGGGEKGESQVAHEYCQGVKENMLIPHGSGAGIGVFHQHEKD